MKIWEKGIDLNQQVEAFTVGADRNFDLLLAGHDVHGSLAHARMLNACDMITDEDYRQLKKGLLSILHEIEDGEFTISDEVEDVHSEIEKRLIEEVGVAGKKIHMARSRNDQVLTDLKLYFRSELTLITEKVNALIEVSIELASKHEEVPMPGFTHMQVAMPSSFGLWFATWAEGLVDELAYLQHIHDQINQNPLGSAAGYGSSFPIDRQLTTELLGFRDLHVSSMYAQQQRGRTEWLVASCIASIASLLNKLAMDACLYHSENYGLIRITDSFTTGSSIMPHKKNPDVMEILRGRSSQLMGLPSSIQILTHNLPSGYHREFQLLKESIFPAIEHLKQCLVIATETFRNLEVKDRSDEAIYGQMYSVEKIRTLIEAGVPFREAYREIAKEKVIKKPKSITYTHIGSPGNPGIDRILQKWIKAKQTFTFAEWQRAIKQLVS